MPAARKLIKGIAVSSTWLTLAIAAAAGVARADETVFSTLSGTLVSSVQLSGNAVGTWNYGAQQFNTGFNNELTSVTMNLYRTGTGGTFNVELWTNSLVGGTAAPGSLVTTIASASTSILSAFIPANQTFSTSVAGLSKFTDYWIVFNALDVGPGTAYWTYTEYASGPGVAGTQYMEVNDGPGWNQAYGPYRAIMEVQAVPEPGALALAGIGCVGLAVSALRRRQRPPGRMTGSV